MGAHSGGFGGLVVAVEYAADRAYSTPSKKIYRQKKCILVSHYVGSSVVYGVREYHRLDTESNNTSLLLIFFVIKNHRMYQQQLVVKITKLR